jgi:DNA-binding NarL/FixJ family response regulator
MKGIEHKMIENGASALIVAKPGPLRDALRSLISAMLRIETVEEANDVPSALRADIQYDPALVFLDSDLAEDEMWLAMGQVKTKWPQSRCVIL